MSLNEIYNGFLMVLMFVLAILILIAIVRSVIGPKMADRIIAVNMIGTLTIVIIAILTVFLNEDYLADVCLVYAMVSFLSVVVLAKIYTGTVLEKKGIQGEEAAINDNLEHQEHVIMDGKEEQE